MSLYPNRSYLSLFLGIFFFQALLMAQEPVAVERTNNKVILGGTVYYIHMVKPGETLYAISRTYHVSQKEIAIENPGVISGLQIGQSLKIPVDPKLKEEVNTSELPDPVESGTYHLVQRGENLYRIARLYNLKESDLTEANPGVTPLSLQPGQRLKIPEEAGPAEEHSYNEEGLVYHTVKIKETLYSIAGYYQVTIDEIRALNPELGWGGPQAGQVLRIPAPLLGDQEETLKTEYEEDESLFSSGDETVEYDYSELDNSHANIRRTYRVAFFIPFDLQEMEPLDSLLKDVSSESRRNRMIERYMMEQRIPQSVQFMELFMGSLLAIDSMRQTGMKLEVRYYDTRKSMDRTRSILSDKSLEDFDLFLGPFYDYTLELVSFFASKHKIPVVTPFYSDLDLLRENPYLFQLSPSLERGYQEAAKLVASKHMYNIVYVRNEDSLDLEKHGYFKQLIFEGFAAYHLSEPPVFKEVIMELRNTDKMIQSLSSDKKNLMVVPTSDEALASTVVSTLYYQQQLNKYDIEVIGGPHWTEFSTIQFEYFHQLRLTFYSPFWVDYYDPRVEKYMSDFRSHFYNEPTHTSKQGINYGILGYDMTFYFLNALRKYGPRFILSLDQYRPELVQDPFTFARFSRGGGYENAHIRFYRFLPDMTIQEFEVPELPQRRDFFRPMEDRRRRRYLNFERGVN